MISYNIDEKNCLCCADFPGNVSYDLKWKSYMPPHCPPGYTVYKYLFFEICLKFVPSSSNHSEADTNCSNEGAELPKLDSWEKYNIFRSHMRQQRLNYHYTVWLQGEEIDGVWRFRDGTFFDNNCKTIRQTNYPEETHLTSSSETDFGCDDEDPANKHHHVCEIYRTFKDF
ncbi:uncharacterized protein LOC134254773 [Saccostrea cucullata]|uniref:uncharacterized protein LOC134254773 n=1 Tax=Saccostrea cuccullata TaxID=36930 RepID=UPI002ED24D4B